MRLSTLTAPAGGTLASPMGTFTYSYSFGMARPDAIAMPGAGNLTISSGYDALARLDQISFSGSLPNLSLQYWFDQGSEVTNQMFTAGNYINYTYDNIGQLKTAQGFEPGGSTPRLHEQFGYGYDKAWNLNYRTNNAMVQSFAVNSLNELGTASQSGTLTVAGYAGEPSASSSLDYINGVTGVTVNSQTADLYLDGTFAATGFTPTTGQNTYTAIGQDGLGRYSTNSATVNVSSGSVYTYDSNGNLTSDGVRSFVYNDENQLIAVWAANAWSNSFAYDGFMRKRIEQNFAWNGSTWVETNELHYIYDGNLVFQERDKNNEPLTTYTRGIDISGTLDGAGGIGGLLARSDNQRIVPAILCPVYPNPQSVVTSYYFSDFDGNVDALVSPSGMILAQYEYDPFGNLIAKGGLMADLNKYRFSSKEWEQNAGLYYYLYRFFDPNLQRWLNRDPIQEKGGINLYEFAMNAPVDNVDGYGLFDLTPPPPPPIPNLTPHDPTNSPTPPTQPPQGPGPTNVPPATYVPISPWTNKPPNFTSSGWFENDGSGVPMFCSGEDTNGLPTGPTVWNGNPVAPIGH